MPPHQPLDELTHLLGSLHEVLGGIEGLLTRIATGDQPSHEATISAGPFRTMDEVREFERDLAAVPGVREVTVRGYEGAANAIIDVHLGRDH